MKTIASANYHSWPYAIVRTIDAARMSPRQGETLPTKQEQICMNETLDVVKKLIAAAERLLHETKRLRNDVQTLNARIRQSENEQYVDPENPYWAASPKKTWPVPDALNMIDQAKEGIKSSEYHLNAIRALLDDIANDPVSRTEMKAWLKE
jgi:hypothetical protein